MATQKTGLLAAEIQRALTADPKLVKKLVKVALDKALDGDFKFMKEILDRDSGKVKEVVETTSISMLTDAELNEKLMQVKKLLGQDKK